MKRGISSVKKVIIIGVIVLILVSGYFAFFYFKKCEDISCFFSHHEKCNRATYINDGKSMTLGYRILGKDKKLCEIEVEVLLVKEGTLDKVALEGHSMKCYVEPKTISYPESDLSKCHGRLKEEIQSIMIKRAHAEIVKNLGEISQEVGKIL